MPNYILGRKHRQKKIVEFTNTQQAEQQAREWCWVNAPSLAQAKTRFDQTLNQQKAKERPHENT